MIFFWRKNKYLFILTPPASGSTLLTEILMTSPHVSCNNPESSRKEGQKVDSVRQIMRDDPWNEMKEMPWPFIKKEWRKKWDLGRPVLLEKSPPNLLRSAAIEKHFIPAFFIVFIRNPYANCEHWIRKNSWSPERSSEFWVRLAGYQKWNLENLGRRLYLRYEDLVSDQEGSRRKILEFIPEIESLVTERIFDAPNISGESSEIRDFNKQKINNLSPDQLAGINSVLKENEEIMDYFQYSLIDV